MDLLVNLSENWLHLTVITREWKKRMCNMECSRAHHDSSWL